MIHSAAQANSPIGEVRSREELNLTFIWTDILVGFLWAALGALLAWLSFKSLMKQADEPDSDGEPSITQWSKRMTGRTIRIVLVCFFLYLSFIMNWLYTLIFVGSLIFATWALAENQIKQSSTHTTEE